MPNEGDPNEADISRELRMIEMDTQIDAIRTRDSGATDDFSERAEYINALNFDFENLDTITQKNEAVKNVVDRIKNQVSDLGHGIPKLKQESEVWVGPIYELEALIKAIKYRLTRGALEKSDSDYMYLSPGVKKVLLACEDKFGEIINEVTW